MRFVYAKNLCVCDNVGEKVYLCVNMYAVATIIFINKENIISASMSI